MKKIGYTLLGFLILGWNSVQNAWALSINDFRKDTYKPINIVGIKSNVIGAETKINILINFFIDLILYASGTLAVLFLVIGGIQYIISFGEQDKMDEAKKTIKFALMGLAAVIMSYFIITNVTKLLYQAVG